MERMQRYRTRPKIISGILSTVRRSGAEDETSISGLMRRCNISYSIAVALIDELVGAGLLLEVKGEKRGVRYKITERGSCFLEKYNQLEEFVQSYGLRL